MGSRALSPGTPFRVRWLGSVRYRDALALQHGLYRRTDDHLLLLEHPHVFTLGVRADAAHLLVDPDAVGADLERADRGGDITYHGPGQVVGYPVRTVPGKRGGGMADTVAYVRSVEALLIDVLADVGLTDTGRLAEYPGVWVAPESDHPRKIAAIGVKLTRGRSLHGFALNVDPDLAWFDHIVPCGIADKAVTSLAAEGFDVPMAEVVDRLAQRGAAQWATGPVRRADVAWRVRSGDLSPFTRGEGPGRPTGRPDSPFVDVASPRVRSRLREAGVGQGMDRRDRKPEWMRVKLDHGPAYRQVRSILREQNLVTVCEEAGCPNISECWNDGTATFMLNGARCTRACGFCLVDTRRPEPLDPTEPARVAAAVRRMGLRHVVLTAVARDDLPDGGASGFVATIAAIRADDARTSVEVLISDGKGDPAALDPIFAARPDVLNHNIETVPRLQRAVRPAAGYARSLAVLARADEQGLTTKSSIIVGMGEGVDEVIETMADLAAVGVDIVTIGQYLRPTSHHVPVSRWWTPDEFVELKRVGERELGLAHVEAGPLTRSSYHARQAAASVS